MSPRSLALRDAPLPWLVPHRAWDTDHPDVMHESRSTQHDHILGGESEQRSRLSCEFGYSARMAEAQRRFEVGEVGEGTQCLVEQVVSQCRTELWVERDHFVPR